MLSKFAESFEAKFIQFKNHRQELNFFLNTVLIGQKSIIEF